MCFPVAGGGGGEGGDTNLRVSNPQIKPSRVGATHSFGGWQTNLESFLGLDTKSSKQRL